MLKEVVDFVSLIYFYETLTPKMVTPLNDLTAINIQNVYYTRQINSFMFYTK